MIPAPEPLDPPAEAIPAEAQSEGASAADAPGEARPMESPAAAAELADDTPVGVAAGAPRPAPPGNPEVPATRGDVFAVQAQVDGLCSEVERVQSRLEELRARPGIVEAQRVEIATLRRFLEEVRSRLARLEDLIENRNADATGRFIGIEAEFGRIRDEFGRVRDEIAALRKEVVALRTGLDDRGDKINANIEASRDELMAQISALRTEVSRITWAISFGVLLTLAGAVVAWFFSWV